MFLVTLMMTVFWKCKLLIESGMNMIGSDRPYLKLISMISPQNVLSSEN